MTAFERVKTALVLLAATLPLTAAGHLLAADVTLSGHILDDAGRPLEFARISVEAGGKRILEQEVQLSADGELRIGLGSVAYDQVRCYIASDGFDQVQITAVVQGTSALLGTVRLRRYIDVGLAQILEYADGRYVDVDFWITSHTARPIIVQQVIVSAPGPKNSPCAAPAPLITMHFDSIALPEIQPKKSGEEELKAVLRVRQEGSSKSQQPYHIAGSYRYDPCGPTIVKMAIPYSFALDTADQNQPRRIRIELPTAIEVAGSGAVRPDWHNASLRTVLEGGETINATSQTKK